ncbi:hypothetical protein [Desulfocastanea catecholica]
MDGPGFIVLAVHPFLSAEIRFSAENRESAPRGSALKDSAAYGAKGAIFSVSTRSFLDIDVNTKYFSALLI